MIWLTLSFIALAVGSANYAYAEEAAHGHDPGHGDASAALESPADFRTDLAIYTFIVFLLLLGILGTLAWPKISVALEEREKRIEANIAAAEAKHEEAKQLLAEHEAKLASAAGEVRALLEEARRDAEVTREEIIAEARVAAKAERDRAVRDIEIAADHAMKNLAETSANLAVDLAGKVIRETINPSQAQELVRSALESLSATTPSKN
jgi:F-type H+-transporting ATPase subunit b